MNPVLFYVLAATMVVSALFVVTKRSPLASALALALNMVALAGIFAGLAAPFLFIVQILVYAGAVIVLIVFVIMLLNLRKEELRAQAIQSAALTRVSSISACTGICRPAKMVASGSCCSTSA